MVDIKSVAVHNYSEIDNGFCCGFERHELHNYKRDADSPGIYHAFVLNRLDA